MRMKAKRVWAALLSVMLLGGAVSTNVCVASAEGKLPVQSDLIDYNGNSISTDQYFSMLEKVKNTVEAPVKDGKTLNLPITDWKRSTNPAQVFRPDVPAEGEPAAEITWKWNDVKDTVADIDEVEKVWDGSRLVASPDGASYQTAHHFTGTGGYLPEDTITADVKSEVLYDSATWVHKFQPTEGERNSYSMYRFQGTFDITDTNPVEYAYTVKPITMDADGDRIYMNDDLYVFIYPQGTTLTDDNFMNYLAFWSGTSTNSLSRQKDGAILDDIKFNGRSATTASKAGVAAELSGFWKLTDGWNMPAVTDNAGGVIATAYKANSEETTYVMDVFASDYQTGGGMYRLKLEAREIKKAAVRFVKVDEESTIDNVLPIAGATFTLEKDGVFYEEVSDADGKVQFNAVPGTYILKEKSAPEGFEKVDTTWTVEVYGDDEGNATGEYKIIDNTTKVEVTQNDDTVNLYQIANDAVTKKLVISKDVTGATDGSANEFEFALTLKDRAGNAYTDELTTSDASLTATEGKYVFTLKDNEQIEITIPYGYEYTVEEADYSDGYKTTVNGEEQREVSGVLTEDTEVEFTNADIEPVSVEISALKVLKKQDVQVDLEEGQFEFELKDAEGNVLDTAFNNSEGSVVFDSLEFDATGTYTYIISEVKGTDGNILYDESEHTVEITVDVNDDKSAFEVKEYKVDGKETSIKTPVAFTNNYRGAATVSIEATKMFDGVPSTKEFEFELAGEEGVLQTKKNDASGHIQFEDLVFDEVGTFTYTISEKAVEEDDTVIYDGTVYEVTVVVSIPDDNHSDYDVDVTYKKVGGTDGLDSLEFVNATRKPATVNLSALKTLDGEKPSDGVFKFELTGEKLENKQVRSTKAGVVNFDTLTFNEVGTYTFEISEVKGVDKDIIYDDSVYTVTVDVTAPKTAGSDSYDAKVTIQKGDVTLSANDPVLFENFTREHTTAAIVAEKLMDGEAAEAEAFTFQLMDEQGEVIETVKNGKDGIITFSAIEYATEGVYKYTISEVNGGDEQIVYDDTVYEATVTVTAPEDNGAYNAVVTYAVNGEGIKEAVFENTTREPVTVPLSASKTLDGQIPDAGQFEFELKDAEGEVLQTVENLEDGTILFDELSFNESGTYNYTISEVLGKDKDIIYDESVYEVQVVVKADVAGKDGFQADVTYTKDGEEVRVITFANETEVEIVKTGDENNIGLYFTICLLSALAATSVIVFNKRRRY